MLWKHLDMGKSFVLGDGREFKILSLGQLSDKRDYVFSGAQIAVENVVYSGDVFFGEASVVYEDSVVLQVTVDGTHKIFYANGDEVPRFVIPFEAELYQVYKELKPSNVDQCACFMADMDPYHYYNFMSGLLYDRLVHKYEEVMEVHSQSDKNWNQTLYVMLFRAMGSPYNKETFREIAKRVPYDVVAHERANIELVEALLYGTSGLLQTRDDFYDYIKTMRVDFAHLQSKYNIYPLKAGQWKLYNNGFRGRPVTRLMQLAAFLHKSNFLFDDVMNISELKEIYALFDVETTAFWRDTPRTPQKLGKDRQESLGINFVAPVMFAYGKEIGDESLQERALELLYKIPVERNGIVTKWMRKGVRLESSADSQSLIELENEYCRKGLCTKCRFGKEQIRLKLVSLSK